MSELRQDPLTGRWTIIGSERAGRPNEFVEESVRLSAGSCPFCAGSEHETPDPVATYPTSGPWQVRVVPTAKIDYITALGDASCTGLHLHRLQYVGRTAGSHEDLRSGDVFHGSVRDLPRRRGCDDSHRIEFGRQL